MLNSNLADLKVGDKVLVRYSGWGSRMSLATVARLLKTQIVTDNGLRFRRHNGREFGGSRYSYAYLTNYDEKVWTDYRIEAALRTMRNTLEAVSWSKIPDDIIRQIFALLPKKNEEAPNEGTSNSSSGV